MSNIDIILDSFVVRWFNILSCFALIYSLAKEFQGDVLATLILMLVGLFIQDYRIFQRLQVKDTYRIHDKVVFEKLISALPSFGSIEFLRSHNFRNHFSLYELRQIDDFHANQSHSRELEFLDAQLEEKRLSLISSIDNFTDAVALKTYPISQVSQGIPPEWLRPSGDAHEDELMRLRYDEHVNALNESRRKVVFNYDALLDLAKRNLFSDDMEKIFLGRK